MPGPDADGEMESEREADRSRVDGPAGSSEPWRARQSTRSNAKAAANAKPAKANAFIKLIGGEVSRHLLLV